MDSSALLHPYRKRKFFCELAELLGEAAPAIQHLHPSQPQAATHTVATVVASTSNQNRDDHQHTANSSSNISSGSTSQSSDANSQEMLMMTTAVNSSSASVQSSIEEESSFEYVEFGVGLKDALVYSGSSRQTFPSQGSASGSTQDSACLVPMRDNSVAAVVFSRNAPRAGFHFDADDIVDDPATAAAAFRSTASDNGKVLPSALELINSDIAYGKSPVPVPVELIDYFDSDRLCEITPCWQYEERPQCEVHKGGVACPMLLFCMQVMDEFISYHSFHRQEAWRVEACKVAQCVFAARWDAHLMNTGGDQEIELLAYVQKKKVLIGVAYEVWRVVGVYWDRYKKNYLHHQELYFADARADHLAPQSSKWSKMCDYTHVYGMKKSQASRLAKTAMTTTDHPSSLTASAGYLSSKHLSDLVVSSLSDVSPLSFGIEYLRQVQSSSFNRKGAVKHQPVHRHVISQSEWKVAFHAIVIHLQKWDPHVQVFPCGSFSRGAAFGSTIDILVALPKDSFPSASRYDEVIRALASAKIVHKAKEHRVSTNRSLFVVPYKKVSLILDLKVYEQPQSWFALVYFTGPQSFAHDFVSVLLGISLRELGEVTFEVTYEKAVEVLGLEKIAAVECEKDVFRLAGWEYLLPSSRM